MTADGSARFTIARRVQAMLEVEVALAHALAEAGLIPAASVPPIRAAARAEDFDLVAIDRDARDAGNLLIPLLRQLTRAVAATAPAAADHVHYGATSQDVIDTAQMLLLRQATDDIRRALGLAADRAAALARRHARTPMAGRTWLQQATPTTFGAKAALWLDGLERAARRLAALPLDVQLGGATGTQLAYGARGPAVAQAFAASLGLGVADVPWHTERSRVADVACALGLTCGVLGKIGRDLTLLAQTEVGEVTETPAPGRGGSSSMPHKHNPVRAVATVAAAMQAPGLVATLLSTMVQEHERAAGAWQAEWDTLPALATLAADGSQAIAEALAAPVVHVERMRVNLDAASGVARAEGLVVALAPLLGRAQALALVERACAGAVADRRPLADVAAEVPQIRAALGAAGIASALDVDAFVDAGARCVEQVLTRWQRQE